MSSPLGAWQGQEPNDADKAPNRKWAAAVWCRYTPHQAARGKNRHLERATMNGRLRPRDPPVQLHRPQKNPRTVSEDYQVNNMCYNRPPRRPIWKLGPFVICASELYTHDLEDRGAECTFDAWYGVDGEVVGASHPFAYFRLFFV